MDFENMTREEALRKMGLKPTASITSVNTQFWKMSKQYRGKDDPESRAKEDEIAALYDIASGRRDARIAEQKRLESEPKILGKSLTQWRTFFSYAWVKIIIGVIILLGVAAIVYSLLNPAQYDTSVTVFGYIDLQESYITKALEDEGFSNPYVKSSVVVVPNDQGAYNTDNGDMTLNALIYTDPQVLVADSKTYPYFFDAFSDIEPIYDQVMAGLTEEARAGVAPVYESEREAVKRTNEIYRQRGLEDILLDNPEEYSDKQVLIGIEIKDPSKTAALGVTAGWKEGGTTLVVGKCRNARDQEKTVKMMITIINAAFKK